MRTVCLCLQRADGNRLAADTPPGPVPIPSQSPDHPLQAGNTPHPRMHSSAGATGSTGIERASYRMGKEPKLPRASPAALSEGSSSWTCPSEDHAGSRQSTSFKPLLEEVSRSKTVLSLVNSMYKITWCVI